MTKNERHELETISRYIKDGFNLLDSGRIDPGKNSVEMAQMLTEALMARADIKKKK